MERKRKIIAALADLKQDIAGPVPVDIISKWQKVEMKSAESEREILSPYERHGYLVSTDSAGLSRLTAERSLLEVMKIVSEPKEIIFQLGRELGGIGVGIWAADNSQMFYDASKVKAEELLDKMAVAQKLIHRGLLQVGMGIHKGTFWQIGGGMFGQEAEMLEAVAEDFTSAKEIILSESVKKELGKEHQGLLSWREDLGDFEEQFFSLNYDQLGQVDEHFQLPNYRELGAEAFYPFPFSRDFFLAMKAMETTVMGKFFQNKVVVLIKIYHPKSTLLLNELTEWVLSNAVLNEVAIKYDLKVVKSNGDLGIFVLDSDREAVEFAEDVLIALQNEEDKVSIGLARGDVLLFNLDDGGMDIAGGAVNIASKISEDLPEQNTLYVESSVQIPLQHQSKYEGFALEKAGVVLKGMRFNR